MTSFLVVTSETVTDQMVRCYHPLLYPTRPHHPHHTSHPRPMISQTCHQHFYYPIHPVSLDDVLVVGTYPPPSLPIHLPPHRGVKDSAHHQVVNLHQMMVGVPTLHQTMVVPRRLIVMMNLLPDPL